MYSFFSKYKKALLPVLVLLVLQLFTYQQVVQYDEALLQKRLQNLAHDIRKEIEQSIRDKQKATTAIALTLSYELSKIKNLKQGVEKNSEFENLVSQIGEHSDYKNLWIQLVDMEGFSIYRSWSPIRNNLAKIRPEFDIIKQTQSPLQSISSGVFDVSIKVVTPIFKEQELIGFLDLISHFNSVQIRLEALGIDSIVIGTEARSKLVKFPFSSHKIGPFYVANLAPEKALMSQLDAELLQQWNNRKEQYWLWGSKLVVKYPLKTPADEVHGYYYSFKEVQGSSLESDSISDIVTQKNRLIMLDVVISIMLMMGLALLVLRKQKQYYQDILNYEEEAVLVTNGKQLIDANNQLFTYFPDMSKNQKNCICDHFIDAEGFLQKYMGDELWINYLLSRPAEQHKALVNIDGEERVFQVKARSLNSKESLSVVVLSDITQMENMNQELHERSQTDQLTQVGNRWHLNEVLQRETALAQRNQTPLSLISFDIDYFKQVNDTYGHATGDMVLQQVVLSAQDALRKTDLVFRVGGEEFIVLLVGQTDEQAQVAAEKIRLQVHSNAIEKVGQVTVSLGVTQLQLDEATESLLARVDAALYKAKTGGRNQVCVM